MLALHFLAIFLLIYHNPILPPSGSNRPFSDEYIDPSQPYELFDPVYTWKRKTVTDFVLRELLEPVFDKGRCVYKEKSVAEIKEYCRQQVETLWDEVLRFEYPHDYYVDLSQKLWQCKQDLLARGAGAVI